MVFGLPRPLCQHNVSNSAGGRRSSWMRAQNSRPAMSPSCVARFMAIDPYIHTLRVAQRHSHGIAGVMSFPSGNA